MPNLSPLRDNAYISGNPNASNNPPGAPELGRATIEPYIQEVLDLNASTTPAAIGKLMVRQLNATNIGGAMFQQSTTAAQALNTFECGIVTRAAQVPSIATAYPGGDLNVDKSSITQIGPVQALCTTTSTAIAVGSFLVADGAGNLTAATGTPSPGVVLAKSLGTLGTSIGTPTLTWVMMGGF